MDLEQQCFNAACWANGYHPFTVFSQETGFKTNSLVHSQHTLREQNIAEDFLINSRMKRNDREGEVSISAYFEDSGLKTVSLIDEKDVEGTHIIPLSEGIPLTMGLGEAMLFRRSKRFFTKDSLNFDYLSTMIRAGFGISGIQQVSLSDSKTTVPLALRMVPSGGGLYPVSLYVAILNVKKINPGIFCFDAKSEQLIQIHGKEAIASLLQSYAAPKGVISTEEACAIFLLIGSPWRSMRKYGNRGLRFVFHEAGAITQNIHLAATALGLSTVDCASFFDEDVHKLLNIDGVHKTFLSSVFLGMS